MQVRPMPFWLLPLLACLLFLSGISALVYQVLWLRLLSLTFGVTTHAASTVLASFMGGLALGSFIAGRLADRSTRPLRLFGLVELMIGACALATPTVLAAVHTAYIALFSHMPDSLALATLARFVMSFAVLLVPTALMGATFPIVLKSSFTGLDGVGTRVGLLYAANTGGAICGALLAGFSLIPHIGLTRSFLLAASLNGIVGLVAVTIGRGRRFLVTRTFAASAPTRAPTAEAEAGSNVSHARRAWLILAVFAISGFASLALEVTWFRVLGILLGPTSYAFTLMLAAVLAGIALGSALITPLMRWRVDWLQGLALLQIGAGLVAVNSFSGLGRPPRLPESLQRLLTWPGMEFLVPNITASVIAILPTAILFGLAFPVGLRLWTGLEQSGHHTAERIGLFYAINTCGAIAGAIAAGFILLPRLGSKGSLIAMAALFLLSGLAIQTLLAARRPIFTLVAVLAAVAFVSEARAVPDPYELARRRGLMVGPLLWKEEGVQTTVVVSGSSYARGRTLYLNGRHQANDSEAMVFIHRRIGLLPAVLHPNPRRALIVGLGGGATPGGLSQYPGLELDVVELSGGVMRAARFFSHVNFDVLHQPNARAHLDDGRNYLLRTRTPYDVITADAILPHTAGSNNLNSVEYFRLVRDKLAPDGVALHWNGGATAAEHKLILRAFVEAFPHATLWGDGTLMVGAKQPLTISRCRIEAMLADPATRKVLALINVETFDHLVRMFRASPEAIRTYLGDGPILTDDKPSLEYFASLSQGERDLSHIVRDTSALVRP
jgi:spermidine synthase